MKRLILTAVVLLLCFVVWWPAGAAAAPDHVIDGDINQSTGSVEISRHTTVNGNVTGNMGAIRVNGAVGGNVEANMGEVDINDRSLIRLQLPKQNLPRPEKSLTQIKRRQPRMKGNLANSREVPGLDIVTLNYFNK